MKVVLLEDIKGLGVRGDVREVGDGYALNFLIPQKKALETKDVQGAQVVRQQAVKNQQREQRTEKEQGIVKMLPDTITLRVPANEQGTLFRAVTADTVVQHLGGQDIPTAPQQFAMEPIKEVGEHTIHYKQGKKTITVIVERDEKGA
ncbi:MAG: 50S ribosomal protein L9 [Candidatus Kaiserbacteria bacterium]|nr:50S ribosomal protein L9 [Candidatus Kaiserbacteria bacterium]